MAMKPRTEKMANPAVNEVRQLPRHTIIVSLNSSLSTPGQGRIEFLIPPGKEGKGISWLWGRI